MTNGNAFVGRTALKRDGIVGVNPEDLIGAKANGLQFVAVKITVVDFIADGIVVDNPAGVKRVSSIMVTKQKWGLS